MITSASMRALTNVDQFVQANKPYAYDLGKADFWSRDKDWIESALKRIIAGDSESLRTVLDEMRNLSQSFGSYAPDLAQLDTLLDLLNRALEEDILDARPH